MENISIQRYQGQPISGQINWKPDECPICHHGIDPTILGAFGDSARYTSDEGLQVFFGCPRGQCLRTFIGFYRCASGNFTNGQLIRVEPMKEKSKSFSSIIKDISPSFVSIYNQAYSAEQLNLLEICGVGYRKSLEFLIKDYLIIKCPEQKRDIEKNTLGNCIATYIENKSIKDVAQRAVWLGNDETHYLRKWEGKDLVDLKKLVDLTVHWFEMEKLTEDITNDMQDVQDQPSAQI